MVGLGLNDQGVGVKFFPQKDQLLTPTHFRNGDSGKVPGSIIVSFIVF